MDTTTRTNKLIKEKSPYLRQHATNPVDWHPWNEETLALAKKLDKPIFLSIGYSTCHWCHVMAHESFENNGIADLMNRHFLNIKVDREERPDVDAIYMTAVQALTGSGGWPMSVWLTPDLKPFYAGTYFPPDDRYGRPGFPGVLTQLAEIWDKDRPKILESSNQITELLTQYATSSPAQPQESVALQPLLGAAFSHMKANFDSKNGGFGPAPKFPMPVYLEFLLAYFRRTQNPEALTMVSATLKSMSEGGIYDQLGGGFARYSTDEKWVVPHFEKMLYDNAQLISVIVSLYDLTKKDEWRNLAEDALAYVLSDLQHSDGGFYSAEDADSEGKEGTFYLWTLHEIKQSLSAEEAEAVISSYAITAEGNFLDPHTREAGQNVLVKSKAATLNTFLESARKKLLMIRNRRPRPHRDEKILTEWNGLMISALAKAAHVFGEDRYKEAACRAARFIQTHLFDRERKQLYRRWADGERHIEAQQVDYAMLIQGLLDLSEATKDAEWLTWATELGRRHDEIFFDEELGGYFMNVPRADLLIRMKDDADNVIPSGNSIAVRNGLRLTKLTGDETFQAKAQKTIRAFSPKFSRNPVSMAMMVCVMTEQVV